MLILGVYVKSFAAVRSMDDQVILIFIERLRVTFIWNTVCTSRPVAQIIGFATITAKGKMFIVSLN